MWPASSSCARRSSRTTVSSSAIRSRRTPGGRATRRTRRCAGREGGAGVAETRRGHAVGGRALRRTVRSALVRLARRAATIRGAANIVEMAVESGLEADRIRRLLALRSEVAWLDERRLWTATPNARRRAAAILRKMLSVAPRLTCASVDDGMRRGVRFTALPTPCSSWLLRVVRMDDGRRDRGSDEHRVSTRVDEHPGGADTGHACSSSLMLRRACRMRWSFSTSANRT